MKSAESRSFILAIIYNLFSYQTFYFVAKLINLHVSLSVCAHMLSDRGVSKQRNGQEERGWGKVGLGMHNPKTE